MRTYIKKERYMDFCRNAQIYGFRRKNGVYSTTRNGYYIVVKNSGQIIAWYCGKQITDITYEIIPSLVWDGYIRKYE